jgi:hypothetical protein
VPRYLVRDGLKNLFTYPHAFFVGGFQQSNHGLKFFPVLDFAHSKVVPGYLKVFRSNGFKNPPTAIDGVIFAVILLIVSKHDFKIMFVSARSDDS